MDESLGIPNYHPLYLNVNDKQNIWTEFFNISNFLIATKYNSQQNKINKKCEVPLQMEEIQNGILLGTTLLKNRYMFSPETKNKSFYIQFCIKKHPIRVFFYILFCFCIFYNIFYKLSC